MALMDFHVIEIISEERDKVWKLYGMSEKELEREKEVGDIKWGCGWVNHLLSDEIRQKYKYWDDVGEFIEEKVFNLTRGDNLYYAGFVGRH